MLEIAARRAIDRRRLRWIANSHDRSTLRSLVKNDGVETGRQHRYAQ
jgi:hypothetical protein